jgi:hypothetical protein
MPTEVFRRTSEDKHFTGWLFAFIGIGAIPLIGLIVGKFLSFWPNGTSDASSIAYGRYGVVFLLAVFSASCTMANVGMWTSFFLRDRDDLRATHDLAHQPPDVFSIFMSYCFGAILGIMLTLFFAGGFVKGNLFPDFDFDGNSLFNLRFRADDWMKLLVWSFLAGFSERMVPTFLEKLLWKFGGSTIADSTDGSGSAQQPLPRADQPKSSSTE